MKQTNTYRTNRMLQAAAVLLCLVLISARMLSGIFARYRIGKVRAEQAGTAVFDVTAEMEDFKTEFPVKIKPGDDPIMADFTVINSGETAVVVKAYLETMGNLPLKLAYMQDGKSDINTNDGIILTENSLTLMEEECSWQLTLDTEESRERTYTVIISWAENAAGYQYANGVETVVLHLEVQ